MTTNYLPQPVPSTWFGPDESGAYYVRTGDRWFYARPQKMLTPEQFAELTKKEPQA